MPLYTQDHQLIEKYLLGRLSEADQSVFDSRLNDEDFKHELALQQDLMNAFKASGREQLKEELKGFEKKIGENNQDQSSPSHFRIGRVLAIAATIALLIIAGYLVINQAPSNDQLFAQYFKPYPNVVNPIDKSSVPTDQGDEAFRQYELGNYQEAIDQFENLNSKEEEVYFYQGISELAIGNSSKAKSLFEKVKNIDGPYYTAARWYLALTLLKSDQTVDAIPLLEFVEQNAETTALKNQATDLLKQLKN